MATEWQRASLHPVRARAVPLWLFWLARRERGQSGALGGRARGGAPPESLLTQRRAEHALCMGPFLEIAGSHWRGELESDFARPRAWGITLDLEAACGVRFLGADHYHHQAHDVVHPCLGGGRSIRSPRSSPCWHRVLGTGRYRSSTGSRRGRSQRR